MPSSPPPEPAASELLAELERQLRELRTAKVEWERERAAIVLERAAIDAERMSWIEERREFERDRVAAAQLRAACDEGQATLQRERAAFEQARAEWVAERGRLQERLAAHERWSPRHWLGVLAHRSATVRRLRSGRDPDR